MGEVPTNDQCSRDLDLIDLAAILLRRKVLVGAICILCVVAAVASHFRGTPQRFVVTGIVQVGEVPAPRVVRQDDVTMSLVLFDSPLTVLEPVLEGSVARTYIRSVAMPSAIYRAVEVESADGAAARKLDFDVDDVGNLVVVQATVGVEARDLAVGVIDAVLDDLVAECGRKEASRAAWLDSVVAAQPDTEEGRRASESLRALAASVETTRVLRPATAVEASTEGGFALPVLAVGGGLVGLSFGVVLALLVELFVRGGERNRRAAA